MSLLAVTELSKSFGTERVLHHVQLNVEAGASWAILGRSGSGKTTLLKCIAGLEVPDCGRVALNDEDVTALPPQQRGIVYLYQEPLLFPHLNVFENVAFGLRLRKTPEPKLQSAVTELWARLGLTDHATKKPHQLSGGQKQRVSLGRALIIQPRILLLDEPLSSLDPETRTDMQRLFRSLAESYHMTTLWVTHDLKEALLMGNQFALLQSGSFTTFSDRATFMAHPASGVQDEIRFWQSLQSPSSHA